MTQDTLATVRNPARLAALRRTALLDTPAEEGFDRLAQLASRILKTPVALVSLVDERRQFFKSCLGLPEPWSSWRETPLSHSFCQHVVTSGAPLAIDDARAHPLVRDNPGIAALQIVAYLGIPLTTPDGYTLGSFCVTDSVPRRWSDYEVGILRDLAALVMTEIDLRAEIQARQRAEAALLDANAELEAFAYSVSHDLRAPLQIVLGFGDLLVKKYADADLPDAKAQKFTREIVRAAHRMNALIGDLLEYSRLGRAEIPPAPVALGAAVDDALGQLQAAIAETAARVTVARPMPAVAGHPATLTQVVVNLLSNALNYVAPGVVPEVRVRAEADGDRVRLWIEDNGIGVAPEHHSRIFQVFERGPGSERHAGSGIGLATVRRAVSRMGGQTGVESQVGAGSRFWVELSAAEPGGASHTIQN